MTAVARLREVFASPEVTHAFATAAVGAAVLAVPIRALAGDAGWLTIVIGLALVARGRDSRSPTILPITVMLPVAWAALSLVWTSTRWATIGGLVPFLGIVVVGIAVATIRDQAQILRILADVARLALALSLVLELASGILLDTPFEFLGIEGNLAQLGPIQGVVGSSDRLGVLAVVAAIAFGVEWRIRAVPRATTVVSLVLAAAVLGFARSGIASIALLAVIVAIALLAILRRASGPTRVAVQSAVVGVLAIGALAAWLARNALIAALDSSSANRDLVDLWQATWTVATRRPVTGWGWLGPWNLDLVPYRLIALRVPDDPASASGTVLDLVLQLGAVGLLAFLAMAGLAALRCWRLATTARPIVSTWPVLVLVALGVASLADSLVLVDWGLLLLVIAAGIGSRRAGWGRRQPGPSATGTAGIGTLR